jgi:hypothetical protein
LLISNVSNLFYILYFFLFFFSNKACKWTKTVHFATEHKIFAKTIFFNYIVSVRKKRSSHINLRNTVCEHCSLILFALVRTTRCVRSLYSKSRVREKVEGDEFFSYLPVTYRIGKFLSMDYWLETALMCSKRLYLLHLKLERMWNRIKTFALTVRLHCITRNKMAKFSILATECLNMFTRILSPTP